MSDSQASPHDPEARYWDDRYAAEELVWSAGPNQFLPPEVAGLTTGAAADLACGEGRNAIWLAEQGWDVTGVDFSQVAIEKASRIAQRRGVSVDWVCADVTSWEPAPEPSDSSTGIDAGFDLVIAFYLQVPSAARTLAMARAASWLRQGGTILVVAHDSSNLTHGVGGPQDPSVLYTAAELVRDIESTSLGFEVERAETIERAVDGSEHPALDCLLRARRT